MKRLLAMALVIALLACGMSGCATQQPAQKDTAQNDTVQQPAESGTAAEENTAAPAASSGDTIRIGVLSPTTGITAFLGQDANDGVTMAFEEVGYEIGGKKVELYFEDTAMDSNRCIEKTQKLVEQYGVQLILGPMSGAEGTAIADYAEQIPDVTVIVAGAASEDITMRGVADNVFRTAYSGAQVSFPFGTYAHDTLGINTVVTVGDDYDFPWCQTAGFVSTFILAGGTVVDRLWCDVGTSDYSSIITQLPKDVDAIYCTLGATDAINFMKQMNDYGLADQYQILGGSVFCDSTTLESDVGYLLDGVISSSHYSWDLPYEAYKTFNTDFEETYGRPSSLFSADYYIAAQVAIAALEKIDGNIDDQDAFRKEILATKMDTARGPLAFDDYHNVIENVYINKVVNVDGVYRNQVLETYENQTQFGPFDPDWYQAQPSADRTNPTEETILNAVFAE